jgi:hypothetical protein
VHTIRRIHRPSIACLLAGALLAFAASGATAAQANDVTQRATAQERYYSSYAKPRPTDAGTSAARSQERYYSSYGEPTPLIAPESPPPSNDTPWLPIAFAIAAALPSPPRRDPTAPAAHPPPSRRRSDHPAPGWPVRGHGPRRGR